MYGSNDVVLFSCLFDKRTLCKRNGTSKELAVKHKGFSLLLLLLEISKGRVVESGPVVRRLTASAVLSS